MVVGATTKFIKFYSGFYGTEITQVDFMVCKLHLAKVLLFLKSCKVLLTS